ncbi:MAG: hypothetical protein E7017_03235 [Alphaproteobacteria bacterium]|nr:hypothetical protein [Alphaproteobacteria bacterium]
MLLWNTESSTSVTVRSFLYSSVWNNSEEQHHLTPKPMIHNSAIIIPAMLIFSSIAWDAPKPMIKDKKTSIQTPSYPQKLRVGINSQLIAPKNKKAITPTIGAIILFSLLNATIPATKPKRAEKAK